ncbi:MAG: TauD/TfdA family dioxygenase [Ilumatobacteraceae bacterium]
MLALGETPARSRDPQHVRGLVERDGAAVLTGWGTSPDHAVEAAHAVFGDDVLQAPLPSEVRAGGERAWRLPPSDHAALVLPRTEGFADDDRFPDYLLMCCAHTSPDGGESYVVDGEAVVDHLAGRPGGRDLVQRLQDVDVDHAEPGAPRVLEPVIGRTRAGRLVLRRFPAQRTADDSADPALDTAMIGAWHDAIAIAGSAAPRFMLRPGDVAVIDNYRMMHGREPYADLDRLMWRVWVWTTAALGVPAARRPPPRRLAS